MNRICLVGSGSVAVGCGDLLLATGRPLTRVYTADPWLKRWSEARDILCLPIESLNQHLQQNPCDGLLSVANDRRISSQALAQVRHWAVNYHDSLLPRCAGSHAASWAIYEGSSNFGITWHLMNEDLDGGDIVLQRVIETGPSPTAGILCQLYAEAALSTFLELLTALERPDFRSTAQVGLHRSYYRRCDFPQEATLWSPRATFEQLSRLTRALDFGQLPNPMGRVRCWTGREFLYLDSARRLESGLPPDGKVGDCRTGASTELSLLDGSAEVTLLDVYGEPGRQVPEKILEVEPKPRAELAEILGRIRSHEPFWREQIRQPFNPPSFDGCGSFSLTVEMLALWLCWLHRTSSQAHFTLGWQTEHNIAPPFDQLFARQVPLRLQVDGELSLQQLVKSLELQIARFRERGTYLLDLASRTPGAQLGGSRSLPVVLSESPLEGVLPGQLSLQLGLTTQQAFPGLAGSWADFVSQAYQQPSEPLATILEGLSIEKDVRPDLTVIQTSDLEHQLVTIWQRVLQLDALTLQDNFFDFGGASMLAAQLCASIELELKVEARPADLVTAPTVARLAQLLEGRPKLQGPSIQWQEQGQYGRFPLNDIQQAYWVGRGSELALGGVSCHVYFEFEFQRLDEERLVSAWQKLIRRHPMLRSIVHSDGSQEILEHVPLYQPKVQRFGDGPKDRLVEPIRQQLSHQVLPTGRWPLFEIQISHFADGSSRVHCSFDALTLDSWSRELLFDEWIRRYECPELELEPLQANFRDYHALLPRLQDTPQYFRDRDFWWMRLDALPPGPTLPLATEPAGLGVPHFERQAFKLSPLQWSQLQKRCRDFGVHSNLALMAAFGEVLRRWSRNQELTLNVTTFNRLPLHPQINQVLGDFGSLLPLELAPSRAPTFLARVQSLATELQRCQQHSLVSGVELMRELARRKGMGPSLPLPVVFTCLTRPPQARRLGRQVFAITQTPQIWIDHWVYDEDDGSKGFALDFVAGLFPENLIADMAEVYQVLLERLIEHSATWTHPWQLQANLLPARQREVRRQVNQVDCPFDLAPLSVLFERQARRFGHQTAVISEHRTLDYASLLRLSRQWAHALAHPRPVLVGVLLEKGWEQVVAVLASHFSGAAYLPLEADSPPRRLEEIVHSSGLDALITRSELVGRFSLPAHIRIVLFDQEPPEQQAESVPVSCDDLAYVIYTSGSTGKPKGVAITHGAAANTLLDILRRFEVGPQDRVLGLSSLSFDLSVYDIFGTLASGGCLVLPHHSRRRDPAHWLELLRLHRVTLWNSVPALMGLLLEQVGAQPVEISDLRLVLLSGDWIPLPMPEAVKASFPRAAVISLGGATEGSIWSIFFPIGEVNHQWRSIPYGKPLSNQSFRVLNEAGLDCPDFVVGELCIQGQGVAQGYWRDRERTEAQFFLDSQTGLASYRTGDFGRYLPDGNLEILGREDTQVKLRGYRIELGEIESHLRACPGVIDAVAMVVSGQSLVACVRAIEPQDYCELLKQRLPAYMVPASVTVVSHFPLTSNGKVDRAALARRVRTLPGETPEPVQNESAAGFLDQLRKLFRQPDLELESNLLARGVSSMDMIRILNVLEQHTGQRPSLDQLYSDPTPEAMLRLVKASIRPESTVAPATYAQRLSDPEEQQKFKASKPGLRKLLSDGATPLGPLPAEGDFRHRRSRRRFSLRPLGVERIGSWLGQLAVEPTTGRRRYGSAGGLYPVQLYLWVKPGRVTGLQGTYYHDPERHQLCPLSPSATLAAACYDRLVNRPIFQESAIALFLVAQLGAIEPIYGDRARHFSTLEAGLMTQLLEERAEHCGLGVCQIGWGEFDEFFPHLALEQGHWLVHSLLAGRIEESDSDSDAAMDEEQRLLERIKNLSPAEVSALLEAEY